MNTVRLNAEQIANQIGGIVKGNAQANIVAVAKLDEAGVEDLCFFANPKYEEQLYASKAGIVIVPQNFVPTKPLAATLIEHANPYFGFCIIMQAHFDPNTHDTEINEQCYIDPKATIGKNVSIGYGAFIAAGAQIADGVVIYPQVYVGKGSVVGADTVLYAGVKIYANCQIGSNCIIHSGTVIGSDGFGFAPIGDVYAKIPQIGNVIIEDNVEIGSNCSVDRATMGSTIIRQGVKLDNLIQVAHNVEIGANTVIAAHTGIAGSAKIGNNAMIGGQVGIAGHITIAPHVGIGAQAGVVKSITEPKTHWIGSPVLPLKDFFKSNGVFKNLPEMYKELAKLKELISKKDK